MPRYLLLFFFILIGCDLAMAQIITPGATLQFIDSGFAFTEGPATDKWGNVFFTDQPNNNIWKYDTSGKLSLFMHGARRSNGMYFDAEGNLISCADQRNEIISISFNKKITVITKGYQGYVLNGPNDIWINRSTGGMYITDPYFQRDYWKRKKPDTALGGEAIYYLPAKNKTLIKLDSSLKKPNGIVGTPDGQYLYVADMGDWKTYRYDILSSGMLSNKTKFADEASDGMTIDEQGNVYLTGNGVAVYNSSGKKIAHIEVPEKWTGNICFGGRNKDVLFITASKSIYTLQTLMKGVE